jgi:predicted nuclease of predicted toxin-antitoxin system
LRFLANENFPLRVCQALSEQGFDIVSATHVCRGARDEDVLARASAEGRVVITFDKDYGTLVFRRKLPAPAGVVFLRIRPKSVGFILDRVLRVLKSDIPLANRFTVVSETRIRSIPVRRA